MQIKSIEIGNYQTKNNIFLAPMAGWTDYSFRHLALKSGYGLCFTELVSAKGLLYKSKNSDSLLYCGDDKGFTGAQIFGSDAFSMRSAIESDYLKDFSIIDINMGCPVPKVYKNGDGSALLKDILKAETILKECVKTGKNITLKIRIGLVKGDDIATEFTKMAENAGVKLVTIHGRVRDDYYSGEPNYDAIYKAKKSVEIPVIANGGLFTKADVETMFENTGVDGVMIARGAFSNPFLINQLLSTQNKLSLKDFMIEHLLTLRDRYGERRTTLEFRKFVGTYLKGINNVKEKKLALLSSDNTEEILQIINEIF